MVETKGVKMSAQKMLIFCLFGILCSCRPTTEPIYKLENSILILPKEDVNYIDSLVPDSVCGYSKNNKLSRYYYYQVIARSGYYEINPLVVRFRFIADGKGRVYITTNPPLEVLDAVIPGAYGTFDFDTLKVDELTCTS